MSDMEEQCRVSNLIVVAKDAQEAQKQYDVWSQTYEETAETLGFSAASCGAQALAEALGEGEGEGLAILDIGAGTGKVGQHLRLDHNFKGEIDLLDANMEMLLLASKKEHLQFRTIIKHFADVDGNLPVKDNSYDALTCMGTFLRNHIPSSAFRGILKSLKCGGVFVFNLRPRNTGKYNKEFYEIFDKLKADGEVVEMKRREVPHNFNWGNATSTIFTLRKMK